MFHMINLVQQKCKEIVIFTGDVHKKKKKKKKRKKKTSGIQSEAHIFFSFAVKNEK